MKKKILLFVLAFAMLFTSLVSTSYAEESGDSGDAGAGTTIECGCPLHNPDYVEPSSSCAGAARSVNIAKNLIPGETITTVSQKWHNSAFMWKLWDEDWHEGMLSSSDNQGVGIEQVNTYNITFTETNYITKMVFVVNSWGQGSDDGGSVWTEWLNTGYTLKVALYDRNGNTISSQNYPTTDVNTVVIEPNSDVASMTVVVAGGEWSGYSTRNVLWEMEIWSTQISHIWELDNTDTSPTCTEEGVGDYVCACGETNADQPIPATGHTAGTEWFIEPAVPEVPAVEDDPNTNENETAAAIPAVPEKHYNVCINGDCTQKLNIGEHVYSNDCDVTCNTCNTIRETTASHTYTYDCQTKCNNCDFVRTDAPAQHSWDHDCDSECNGCYEGRTTEHVYTDCEDTTCNSGEGTANACGATREAPGHAWTNACDTTCNNTDCEVTRTTEHQYDTCEDTECNECGTTRAALTHAWADCEDTTCDTCGMARTAPGHAWTNACDTTCNNTGCTKTRTVDSSAHVYENACDGTCNNEGCTVTRTPADHVYDNTCDTKCNVCEAERTIEHTYDNACDKTCNVCNAERTVADHVDADENELCDICNAEVPKKGLSGGAIAGIVIGSVAVVGGGGFAAWWFIFRKKAI